MTLDLKQALGISQALSDKWSNPTQLACERYDICSPLQQAAFIAQVGHESGLFSVVEENLRYSEQGLKAVFGRYFRAEELATFARRAEPIANRVYASRMGNGNEASGDGYKFRGRGLLQVTGRDNYRACGKELKADLEKNPELLCGPIYASLSAAWFWSSRDLNMVLAVSGFEKVTRVINGGVNGQADRLALFEKAKASMGVV